LLRAAEATASPGAGCAIAINAEEPWIAFRAPDRNLSEDVAALTQAVGGTVSQAAAVLMLRVPAADWSPSQQQ